MTRPVLQRLFPVAALLALAACAFSPIAGVEGDTVYTQRNLWVASNQVHETTNYSAGYRIPVNTQVRIGDTSERAIKVEVPETGERFTIVNVRKYTDRGIEAVYRRYFDASPQDLDRFDAATREAIRAGRIEHGMNREAVLIARGYPPIHKTPSIRMDEWTYWKGGHDTLVVRFEGERVASVVD